MTRFQRKRLAEVLALKPHSSVYIEGEQFWLCHRQHIANAVRVQRDGQNYIIRDPSVIALELVVDKP